MDARKRNRSFASTRSVQIATPGAVYSYRQSISLPPHAPCRLQPHHVLNREPSSDFASTRSVQIATGAAWISPNLSHLCLHTLRADCNGDLLMADADVEELCLHTLRADCNHHRRGGHARIRALPPHAPCRLQRQKCTELQYTLFRTRVESVDSFSVLNKSMLR